MVLSELVEWVQSTHFKVTIFRRGHRFSIDVTYKMFVYFLHKDFYYVPSLAIPAIISS